MNELRLKASSLAAEGENGGAAITPGVGDTVTIEVVGKVSRVEGENVYVTPESANGEPMTGEAKDEPAEMNEADMDKEMRGMMEEGAP